MSVPDEREEAPQQSEEADEIGAHALCTAPRWTRVGKRCRISADPWAMRRLNALLGT